MAPSQSTGHGAAKVHVPCPLCGSIVAVPRTRLADGPRCGRCKAPVLTGRPTAVQGKRLTRALEQTQLPLLLDAGAEWCGPCKAFAPIYEQVAGRLHPDVLCLTFDVDADQPAAARLSIQAVPTLILFQEGTELARSSGAGSADDVVAWVRSHLANPNPSR